MRTRVFIILAAALLFFLLSFSIKAYERPPGQDGLRVDDRYEGSHWEDISGSQTDDDYGNENLTSSNTQPENSITLLDSKPIIIIYNIHFRLIIILNTLEDEKAEANKGFEISGRPSTR